MLLGELKDKQAVKPLLAALAIARPETDGDRPGADFDWTHTAVARPWPWAKSEIPALPHACWTS